MVIRLDLPRLKASLGEVTYPTPKVLRIYNWKLGLLRYALLLGVFLFILVNQILMNGNHLRTVSVSGNAQVSFHLPTVGNCDSFLSTCRVDFSPMNKLNYCRQGNYTGDYQKQCVYRDPTELGAASLGQDTLIPTNIKTFVQRRSCFPDELNDWSCPHGIFEYLGADGKVQPSDQLAEPWSDLFVADVERFRLLLDHSAVSDGGVNAESFQMSGTWKNCSAGLHDCIEEPILCISRSCESDKVRRQRSLDLLKRSAPVASERAVEGALNKTSDEESEKESKAEKPAEHTRIRKIKRTSMTSLTATDYFDHVSDYDPWDDSGGFEQVEDDYVQNAMENNLAVSLQRGDIFPVSLLLQMAGVKLDETPEFRNVSTYRSEGFSLTVRVHYSNVQPWIGLLVLPWQPHGRHSMHYAVEAIRHPSQSLSRRVVREENKNFTSGRLLGNRVVEEDRGISIVVQQYGEVKVWDFTHFLVILTTSLAMLAVANFILDTIALHCMERSEEYQNLKYETRLTSCPDLDESKEASP